MIQSYPEMAESFWKDQIELLLNKFPEGQLVMVDGIVVGSALCWLPKISLLKHVHKAITGFHFNSQP
jgi:hypothetical protein